MRFEARNPATGELVATYPETSDASLRQAVDAAQAAQHTWARQPVADRSAVLSRAAQLLSEGSESYAHLMAIEMGKPVTQGRAEAQKCAWLCRYYAEHANDFLADESVATEASCSYVSSQPLGLVLAIMPWNFPFWQVFRCAVPALVAGNGLLLKHAPNVPGCALAIQDLMSEAGLAPGLFQTLLIDHRRTEQLIADRRIRAITLTGSTRAGREVGAQAGHHLKKAVLELGGSDPYLVLEDADVEQAAELCAQSRLLNSGQSCIAAKRFLVVDTVRKPFQDALVQRMASTVQGDPLDEGTELGPMAREDLRRELHRQVEQSLQAGAQKLLGGELPKVPGFYYPASVLSGVLPGMAAAEEELFGPVAAVIAAHDAEHAVRLANDSAFGLGAAVFTSDVRRGEEIARDQLEAGCCFVNDMVRSDPRLPFGGIKDSGYGRELGLRGLQEFLNHKTIWVR